MDRQKPITKVLLVQSAGFLAIIALSWFDEFVDLRSLILGDHPYISDFRESALEMLMVLAVWFVVAGATRRLIQRVYYLEGFARVCAWCHHICYKGTWVRFEEFLEQGFDTPTTHGMCPRCERAQKAALEQARKAANDRTQGDDPAAGAAKQKGE